MTSLKAHGKIQSFGLETTVKKEKKKIPTPISPISVTQNTACFQMETAVNVSKISPSP
jgi:hypothetical protein